jgi:hypothetical protein
VLLVKLMKQSLEKKWFVRSKIKNVIEADFLCCRRLVDLAVLKESQNRINV